MLTSEICRNAVALINRAHIEGKEVEVVAHIKLILLEHAKLLDADKARQDKPHKPTMAEIIDMERSE